MRRRPAAIALCCAAGLAFIGLIAAGQLLSAPVRAHIGDAPPDLGAVRMELPLREGGKAVGWFARGRPHGAAVLLLHGVRASRTQMLARARFLHSAGYSVLLIDLPAHGESSGPYISFGGKREQEAVQAALAQLRRELPGERIGVIGVSLGAASLVLARPVPAPDAVVLESMYPTIDEAVTDRLSSRLGPAGAALAPLLLWQLPLVGASPAELRPIDAIGALHAPLLIASGMEDQHTTWAETERLYRAARQPKELWPFAGAAHVDLHSAQPEAYRSKVLAFFDKHLRAQSSSRE
jgi:alpha-beta hydrolase superfamily lysophospholipase